MNSFNLCHPSRSNTVPDVVSEVLPNDADLVRAMSHKDQAAIGTLYDRYSAGLFGLALRITGETADAEEVLTDTFSQAWSKAASFDEARGSVSAWLVTIARSRALDLVRSRGRRKKLVDKLDREGPVQVLAMGRQPEPADAMAEAAEQSTFVARALDQLPDTQREVIELGYFHGLSQREVAMHLGEPLGTIKTRARLGLAKLRDLLSPLAGGEVR